MVAEALDTTTDEVMNDVADGVLAANER